MKPLKKDLNKELNKTILLGERVSLWDLIFKYTIRDFIIGILTITPASIGVGLRMLIMPQFFRSCGRGVTIRNFVTYEFPERISIGDHVSLNEYCWLNGVGGIEIGNLVRIAPRVSIISFGHGHEDRSTPIKLQEKRLKKVVIEDDVWIGAHCSVLMGVKIGQGSVIGAGSVVTKDIPPYSIAVGSPARVIKKRGK